MEKSDIKVYTIIYQLEESLVINDAKLPLRKSKSGRVIIPDDFKKGRHVIAVIDGPVNVLDRLGDRMYSFKDN